MIIAGKAFVNAPAINIAKVNSVPETPDIISLATPHTHLPASIEIISAG